MSETIKTKFDKNDLPEWAKKNPAVVEFCKKDLGFRVSVIEAETPAMRQRLIKEAERIYS